MRNADDLLDESISLAPASHRVTVQIYKFKFSKWFEHLSDVRLGQIEMQGAHVKPETRISRCRIRKAKISLHSAAMGYARWEIQVAADD